MVEYLIKPDKILDSHHNNRKGGLRIAKNDLM